MFGIGGNIWTRRGFVPRLTQVELAAQHAVYEQSRLSTELRL